MPYTHTFSAGLAPELVPEGASVAKQREMMGAHRSGKAGLRPSRTAGHGVDSAAMPNRTLPGTVS